MSNYFESYDKKECNGCGACALRCPQNAITMIEDSEGFLYPEINQSKCIECDLCKKICPNKAFENDFTALTYAAINKNYEEKQRSSSGGMFFPIAKYVIKNNGVVFGVVQDKKLNVYHDYAETIEECKKFQGSKYVRSDLRNSFVQVKEFLDKNRIVLFTGTPCQCAGLKAFLIKEYENLITCEIVCHANPSPKVYKYYLKNLELIYNKKVEYIYFRSKENGWRNSTPIIEFEDKSKIAERSYYQAFVAELINRPSCNNCFFVNSLRCSDFSIADFWGIENFRNIMEDDDTGISLLNVNTLKGKSVLNLIENDMFLKTVNTAEAFSGNHHKNVKVHPKREIFFKKLSDGEINENNIIKNMNQYTKRKLYKRIFNKIKTFIKI